MKCPNCQTVNPEEAKFCLNCGTKLQLVCPECATENPPTAKFCLNCGHQFGAVGHSTAPNAELERIIPAQPTEVQPDFERLIPAELASKLESARSNRAMEGERRIVTMLFCDIVGSTAAAEQLDPEEWTDVMNNAFEYLITPVYKYEGTLARLMGDAILAFFGAPIAHEDDPQRSILAGLEIVENIRPYCDEIKDRYGIDIDVRVGINTGLVVIGQVGSDLAVEYTAMGDAVNLAARMEQTALPGTVHISEDTHKLVAPLFEFNNLGPMQVKGRSTAVDTFQVIRPITRPGQVRGIEGLDAPLIGRDPEMHLLRGAVLELLQGRGQIISVVGEAGLGKSRLVAELHRSPTPTASTQANIIWIEGRSLSYETTTPYAPFIQLFTNFFGINPAHSEEERFKQIRSKVELLGLDQDEDYAAYLATMLGVQIPDESLERVRFLEPPQVRERVFRAAQQVVEHLAANQPVILVLDDLHWIDPTSIALLEFLLPITERQALIILTIFRPRRSEPSWQFHEFAGREYAHRYQSVHLDPLDQENSNQLVANLLQVDDLPQNVRTLILEKSEGNPFYVEEVIRSLLDASMVIRENGHWVATQAIEDITVPDTLVGVITSRLDKLGDETKGVAQAAAVIGRQFEYEMLAAVTGAQDGLDKAITDLQRREIIREKSRLPERVNIFKHVLTQETVYMSLLKRKKEQYHLRAAEYMEKIRPEIVNEISRHLLEAGEESRAAPYLVEAGDQAARAYSTPEAIGYYTKALEVLEPTEEFALSQRAYEGLGKALTLTNDVEKVLENYQAMLEFAQAHEDIPAHVSALNKLSQIKGQWLGQFDEAEEHLVEAERLAKEHQDQVGLAELYTVRCGICNLVGDFSNAAKYLGKSVEIGRELDLKEQIAFGLSHMASTLTNLTQFDEAAVKAGEALELSRAIGNRFREAEVLTFPIPFCHLREGDLDSAYQTARQGTDIAKIIGSSFLESIGEFASGYVAQLQGNYQQAITNYNHAIDAGNATGLSILEVGPLCSLGSVYLDISETFLEEVLEYHDQATQLLDSPMGASAGGFAWADLGFCLMVKGDLDSASEYFQKGLTVPSMQGLLNRPRFLQGSAMVALAHDQIDQARDYLHQTREFVEQRAMKYMYPSIAYYDGLISAQSGEVDHALDQFQIAKSLANEINMRPIAWQSLAQERDLFIKSNRHKQADDSKRQAKSIINEIGNLFEDPDLRSKFIESATANLESTKLSSVS